MLRFLRTPGGGGLRCTFFEWITKARRIGVMGLCLMAALVAPSQGHADPVITELMADNTRTLKDEDGDFSDWIEIQNPDPVPVNLSGWYLTDDPNRLTQWAFPSTNLVPGQFLVVFASSKNRRVAGRPLHTSFKLDADGEYLALVRPDGRTIAAEFSPRFPAQWADVSLGVPPVVASSEVLDAGRIRYFVPGVLKGTSRNPNI